MGKQAAKHSDRQKPAARLMLMAWIDRGVPGSTLAGGIIGIPAGTGALLLGDSVDLLLIKLGFRGYAVMAVGCFLCGGFSGSCWDGCTIGS